ncbi:MAG: hypothetical protein L0G99_04415 [Propionibacteriales bacterium]|nr:hypothetical protein [Propionibacteriales bacterium]
MSNLVTVEDLREVREIETARAEALIADAEALAVLVAPCLESDDFPHTAAAKAILRQAVLRRDDAGSGALQSQSVGPWSQTLDTRASSKILTADDERRLKALCPATGSGRARSIDTAPRQGPQHPLLGAWVNGPDGYAPGEQAL